MDDEHLQTIAARDQFWTSLQTLRPRLEALASGTFDRSLHEDELVQLLARIVLAEMAFRAEHAPE